MASSDIQDQTKTVVASIEAFESRRTVFGEQYIAVVWPVLTSL